MGNAIGRVTGRSPAYSAVLLFVLARYAAVRLRGPGRTAATARVALLQRIAGVLASPGRIPQLLSDVLGLAVCWKILSWGSAARDFYRLPADQKYDLSLIHI